MMSSEANRTVERSVTTLLVRHLPKELTNQEKIDLLCHFGADRVRPMGTKGRMKHTAFAQFDNPATAENSIKRIHQLEILGCKLVVEYARLSDQNNFPSELESKKLKPDDNKSDVQPTEVPKEVNNIDAVKDETFKKHGIQYPRKPNLHYLYPPPSVSTLTNIANALASHPRFYVQVLHLMNKMNIPAPFGVVTPTPPLASDARRLERSDAADLENSSGQIEEVEMEYTSTEESEISDDEASRNIQQAKEILPQRKVKRPRKKMRVVKPDITTAQLKPTVITTPREIFEQPEQLKSSQIQFNLTGLGNKTIPQPHLHPELGNFNTSHSVLTGLGNKTIPQPHLHPELGNFNTSHSVLTGLGNKTIVQPQLLPELGNLNTSHSLSEQCVEPVAQDGFGKIEPKPKPSTEEEIPKPDINYEIDPAKFYTYNMISESKLTKQQMRDFSVFKNYSAGEPTCRLYIKNLTKHTAEQDIVNLFGSFVDWSQEAYNSFDVRVMKEGRMKGQGFVSLPNEEAAKRILNNCNGFVMNGKPMVIQFARSAKAKIEEKK